MASTRHKFKMKSGREVDALTGWRHYLSWRSGVRAGMKRKHNRWIRREWSRQLRGESEHAG